MDRWAELRTAYQVARLGTVSAAAQRLKIHRATVNRHIDILEAELGARIFIRHAKGYTLTDIGEDVLRVAQKTEELTADLAGRARGATGEVEGEIRVTVLPLLSNLLMTPVADFRKENPKCKVTVIASEVLEKLEYGDAHIALRVGGKPDHPDYVVSSYGRIGINLCAHDTYVARKGLPGSTEAFHDHDFVLPEDLASRLPFGPWATANIPASRVVLTSSHPGVVTQAVLAGLGIGFLNDTELMNRQDIHIVLQRARRWHVPLWLVTHVDLHRTKKIQKMLHCLKASRQRSA